MTGFPPDVREQVKQRANYCCERCGLSAYGGSIHHRRPRGMGGDKRPETNAVSNALLLCGSGTTGCHGWVERNRADAYDLGLLVRRNDDPSLIPVELHHHGLVYLTNHGTYEGAAA